MLVKISLIVALCSNLSTSAVSQKMNDLESRFPGSKVTLRLDRKATCDAQGRVLEKKSKRNQVAER